MTSSFEFDFNSVKLPTREIFCLPTYSATMLGGDLWRATNTRSPFDDECDRQTDRQTSFSSSALARTERPRMHDSEAPLVPRVPDGTRQRIIALDNRASQSEDASVASVLYGSLRRATACGLQLMTAVAASGTLAPARFSFVRRVHSPPLLLPLVVVASLVAVVTGVT